MRVVGIRDFEMPSCCAGCKFADLMRVADGEPYDYFLCLLNDQEHDPQEQHRPFNCPLVWAEETNEANSSQQFKRRQTMNSNFKLLVYLDNGAYMPDKAHSTDAGFDLRTPNRVVLREHSSACIDTGVHIDIPAGWYGKLESKSGLNVKHSIVSLGGVIDAGYTGNIVAKLYNLSEFDYVFEAGDKIVQIIIQPCTSADSMEQVISLDKFHDSDRGDNGFGSSGK